MKITDKEMQLDQLISVFTGIIPKVHSACDGRLSDGLVLVLSGSASYDFGSKRFSVRAADVFFLPMGSRYTITLLERDYRYICVNFTFRRPEAQEAEADVFQPGSAMENAFRKVLNLWKLGDFSDKLLCRSVFYEIYAGITKAAATAHLDQAQRSRLDQVTAYISEHYTNPDLSVAELAALCETSEVHFRRLFSRLYRTSPIRYITALRLSKARELLAGTELPISRICSLCGYRSVYYFDRVFKREFGMQPGQFRQNTLI